MTHFHGYLVKKSLKCDWKNIFEIEVPPLVPGQQLGMDVTWLPTATMDPTGYYMFLKKEDICQMTTIWMGYHSFSCTHEFVQLNLIL